MTTPAEAAVEAMAGALASHLYPSSGPGAVDPRDFPVISRRQLTALVKSETVRAGLVGELCRCFDIPPGQRFGIRHFNWCPVADDGAAILAALTPGVATP